MNELKKIATEIRGIISDKQKNLGLTFEENNHIYTMNGKKDYPSVSKVLKNFYKEFPTDEAALNKSNGDPEEAERLKEEWAAAGTYSTNMGSRVHFVLEKKTIDRNGKFKEVRQPVFKCDPSQLIKGDAMIKAGENYINLMEERGAVLLDTEMILGDPELGYVGQPDNVWLMMNRNKTECGIVITDYKTNKPKNFQETSYTKRLKDPFGKFPDTALGHYYLQLPFYGKLLLKMLKGSRHENMKLLGCVISHLKDDASYDEYKVPQEVVDIILGMDMSKVLKK